MDLNLSALRKANLKRVRMWHLGGVFDWSLSDWGVAAGGEMGEALNCVKKLNRDRDGLVGNSKNAEQLMEQLGEEIADTIIYLDLLAARAGIDLADAIIDKFNKVSNKNKFRVWLDYE